MDIELLASALDGIVPHRFCLVAELPAQELALTVFAQIIPPAVTERAATKQQHQQLARHTREVAYERTHTRKV